MATELCDDRVMSLLDTCGLHHLQSGVSLGDSSFLYLVFRHVLNTMEAWHVPNFNPVYSDVLAVEANVVQISEGFWRNSEASY